MASNVIFASVIGVCFLSLVTATNVTRCFNCQSPGQPFCDDEFDIAVGSVGCSSLWYGRSAEAPPDLIQNVVIHERTSNTTEFTFHCIKLIVQYENSTNGIARSCHKHPSNAADICEFIRAESMPRLTNVTRIPECHVCNTDECNSAGSIYASILMIFIAVILNRTW